MNARQIAATCSRWESQLELLLRLIDNSLVAIEVANAELELYVECHDLRSARRIMLDNAHKPPDQKQRPHWPNPPSSEVSTDRNGSGTYLYLYWSDNEGPRPAGTPQRRTYIGNKPGRITLARTMATNIERKLTLQSQLTDFDWAIRRAYDNLDTAQSLIQPRLDQLNRRST